MTLVGCKNRITKNVDTEEQIEAKETKEMTTSIESKNQNLDVPPHYNLEDLPIKK
jgi:hypothetical protein